MRTPSFDDPTITATPTDPDKATATPVSDAAEARSPARRRVVIFNVKCSPNLGDGLIAECLERELEAAAPELAPISADLAGRPDYSPDYGRNRRRILLQLEKLPAPLRQAAVSMLLGVLIRWRYAPFWRERLAGAQAAVIGGGALFADADLNFPLKINAALRMCARSNIPVAVTSVGVARNWSRRGRRLFVRGLARVRLASVTTRDRRAQSAWNDQLAGSGIMRADLAPDPGLLTADHFPAPPRQPRDRPLVGLCLTAPVVLRLHGHDDPLPDPQRWIVSLVEALAQHGYDVVLFANGSPEDYIYRDLLLPKLKAAAGDRLSVAPSFVHPRELATFIASLDLVLAHRLHACIAAYAYRVPSIGFAWDMKIDAFFEETGRSGYLVDPRRTAPAAVADLAGRALADPIDPDTHAVVTGKCREGIAALAATLAAV